MSLAQVLSLYSTLNILLVLTYLFLSIYSWIAGKMNRPLSAQYELRLHYSALATIVLITLAQPFLPKKSFFEPAAKVWSAQSIKSFPSQYSALDQGGYLSIPFKDSSTFNANKISTSLFLIAIFIFLAGAFFIGKDLDQLFRIKQKSYLFRKNGRVSLFINDEITVPFSYWTINSSNIILPNSLLSQPKNFKIAIAHELQHHRQKDTQWVYIIWLLRVICILNPFVFLWSKKLSEIQEFACDEALVDQNKVESQQYARCLIEVAQTAFNQKYVPACATGLMFLVERNLIKKRIEKMTTKNKKMKSSITSFLGMLMLALMMTTAFASQGLVQDRRVSLAEANVLASHARIGSDFPVVVNDLVLTQLNRYIGTPEGRDFMKKSIQRMSNYKTLVETKINEYSVPSELIAIPIIESGYQNLAESNLHGVGAGLWMFIKSTAKHFELTVDHEKDDRLNEKLETDAAMRYLQSNHLLFKDWLLATLGYNMGENNVLKAIEKTGSHDAWALIRQGYEGDKDYLPKLVAAIIIMRNPEVLN